MIANNAFCMPRLHGFDAKTIHGHAMSFDLLSCFTYGIGDLCLVQNNAPLAIEDTGSSVPIVREGPPIFTE